MISKCRFFFFFNAILYYVQVPAVWVVFIYVIPNLKCNVNFFGMHIYTDTDGKINTNAINTHAQIFRNTYRCI